MDHEYETVRVDDRGEGLLLLTLNRPEVANALNTQMGRDLLAFFDAINAALDVVRANATPIVAARPETRAVIDHEVSTRVKLCRLAQVCEPPPA